MRLWIGLAAAMCLSQVASTQTPAAAPPATAVAPAAVDAEKQIATMEAKLADWPQLGRYRAENAALGPVGQGEQRVVFYGTRLRMDGDGGRIRGSSFRGSRM